MKRTQKAFTLIELLVVIAIIAILAAILFPVFAQAREKARGVSCLSNTKQVALGILQYVQDYDEQMPISNYDIAGTSSPIQDHPWGNQQYIEFGWDRGIFPYVKSTAVFKCPSGLQGDDSQAGLDGFNYWRTGAVQYAANMRLVGFPNATNGGNFSVNNAKPLKLAGMSWPSVTILLRDTSSSASVGAEGDERGGWGWDNGHNPMLNGNGSLADLGTMGSGGDWDDNKSIPANDAQRDALCHQGNKNDYVTWQGGSIAPLRRHTGGGNYAFADGHAKWASGDASCIVWDARQNRSGNTMTYFPSFSGPQVP